MQGKPENLFRKNAFLLGLCKRFLPHDVYLLMAPRLENFGEEVESRAKVYAEDAERFVASLSNFDAFGERIDKLHLSEGWLSLRQFAHAHRLVALGYDKRFGAERRSLQAIMQIMFSAYSSTYSCPLAMTDGATSLLLAEAPQSIKERVIPEFLSKDGKSSATCGQWMTEKQGGSDLKKVETQAVHLPKVGDAEEYRLFGLKFFASAIDSDYALVLAQIAQEGPSLFFLRVWEDGKLSNGIRIERLKNKLGTRGLPTAEVRLEGAVGSLIGPKGRGIAISAPLLTITRFYNTLASASIMNRAFYGALQHAESRKSFGKRLLDHTLHAKLLADIDAKRAGATALSFEIARLLGLSECKEDEKAKRLLRALVPIAKIVLGKMAVIVASDCIEAIGGAGYIEESGFPQLLRDAQVLPIWEGTSNILVHDVLRAQQKERALVTLLRDLSERANNLMIDEGDALRVLRSRLTQISEKVMTAVAKGEDQSSLYLEAQARKLVFSIGAIYMALLLAENKPFITDIDPFAPTRFSTFVENNLCGHFSI